jgi:hypothetical protein
VVARNAKAQEAGLPIAAVHVAVAFRADTACLVTEPQVVGTIEVVVTGWQALIGQRIAREARRALLWTRAVVAGIERSARERNVTAAGPGTAWTHARRRTAKTSAVATLATPGHATASGERGKSTHAELRLSSGCAARARRGG